MRPGLGGAAALLVAAGILTGCGTGSADQPLVVVTTDVLGDVVGELVGAQAEVMTLMPRGSDPHSFEVSAQDAARLRSADLVVSNGLGLEEGLAAQVEAARADGVPVLEAGTAIEPLQWVSEDASGLDPHFWTDPARMTTVTEVLADALTEHVEGIDVDVLAADVADYQGRLAELDAWMGEQLAQVPADRRNLVTNHHVLHFLLTNLPLLFTPISYYFPFISSSHSSHFFLYLHNYPLHLHSFILFILFSTTLTFSYFIRYFSCSYPTFSIIFPSS
ncbi:metal ABC transporter substrate-binding protein [Modestobacter sp. L9-4]|uniref:metal ABC transporter substrate-binding protein n=1 Tax=Modestobacter sp. L9-4 TaxID=2851567 RepID=UPI001C777718|nr:metal ABC transporter substrate-binding protein [Modestobacter sp. L9-4]QXG76288.1 metal ABC transporter substrate-binding protein [Modestobacter sp. L9-4]